MYIVKLSFNVVSVDCACFKSTLNEYDTGFKLIQLKEPATKL